MLEAFKNAVSRTIYGRQTAAKELDVIVKDFEYIEAGQELYGVAFKVPFYHLSLACAQEPTRVRHERGYSTTMESFHGIIEADKLDAETITALKKDAPMAIKGHISESGKGWGVAFVTGGGLGSFFYELSAVKPGKAQNPANAYELLTTISVIDRNGLHL